MVTTESVALEIVVTIWAEITRTNNQHRQQEEEQKKKDLEQEKILQANILKEVNDKNSKLE